MALLSVLDTKKKPKSIDKSAELLKQAEAQTKYPLGDGKIKNPADYFREPPSDAYDPRANPTSISLSTRCHPQEVFEQSVVKLYGEKPLSYLLQTMLNCRKNARLARKNGDYERSCILFSRAIGLAIDLPSYQDYYERFGHKGEEGRKKLKLEAVEEAATLAPCINARFFLRRDGGREVEAKHAKPERPPRDVWLELGRSWRAVKSSITTKSETATTPPDLVVQNLQLEAEYVTPPAVVPQPSPFPWGQTQVPASHSGTGRSESRGSTHGRRSSIVKVDKDLPPPPKQAEAEGYSFNVEYTDSPSSTVPTRAWESEDPDDDDESLPTYGAVLLEAYADDPTPPALVLAFRRGQVTDEDMGYLSGANSSVTSLLGDVSTGGTVFHSAASTAPPSDSEDTVSSRKGIREKVPDVKRSDEKVSEKGSKTKANSLEQANAEIAQSRHQFERELDAALRHLETITTARQSLPPDEAEHEVFDEKTKFAVKKMNEMVNPQKKAGY